MTTIMIVAGEQSGDNLGEGLIQELSQLLPDTRFIGIGGGKMQAAGLEPLADMELLSVMGFIEPIPRIPKLFALRQSLIDTAVKSNIDVFIGIDAPAFNTGLERKLKERGIRTVHYVSPSVWAWRKGRIHAIKQAVDLMLTLFPFESSFYQEHQIPSVCVGHPLAEKFPMQPDKAAARAQLGLQQEGEEELPVFAIMPGSRRSEVKQLLPDFLKTTALISQALPQAMFILPVANSKVAPDIQALLADYPQVQTTDRPAAVAMTAADVCLMASGTVTLEGLFCKVPMVAAYRFNWLTYQVAKRLVKTDFVTLPNILAGKEWVPEYIQEFTPRQLADAMLERYQNVDQRQAIIEAFYTLHQSVNLGGDKVAAQAVANLVRS
ncbi:MAG: lipid-A-disaccharide synthase [Pseudomonadota bacterium]|nr:lipid-A-disaccharide synthase [Pseudomonadota bacterium]